MNWIKLMTPALRVALAVRLLAVCLCVANVALANSPPLVVRDGETLTLHDTTNEINLESITIEEGGELTLAAGTMVYLESGEFRIDGGTLNVSSAPGTGIHSGNDADGEPIRTTLEFNGGILNILTGGTNLDAATIDLKLIEPDPEAVAAGEMDTVAGTIDVATGIIVEVGKITGGKTGDLLKIGAGTLQVDVVSMGGNFTIEEGTVEFLKMTAIGGNFMLELGTVEFHDITNLYGNLTAGQGVKIDENNTLLAAQKGTMTFHETAYIAGNVTVEFGEVEFLETAKIGKNLTVGQSAKYDENNTLLTAATDGIVTFHNTAEIGGILDVQDGKVSFGGDAKIGTLHSAAGTLISGKQTDEHGVMVGTSDLTITSGGTVKGQLEDIGELLVGGGKLTLEGGTHTMENLGIVRGATLNLNDGTLIQLTSQNDESTYDDLIVEGTLRMSSAATGITRGSDDIYLLVAGYTDSDGEISGGIVDIYKSDTSGTDHLVVPTLHTQVVGIGKVIIEQGVTFESGTVGIPSGAAGAHVIVEGGGTYKTAEMNLGVGYLVVREEGTTVEWSKTATGGDLVGLKDDYAGYVMAAGALISARGTRIVAGGHAAFETVDLGGSYDGMGNNLFMKESSRITGNITNINALTVGGDLLLVVDHTIDPTISTNTWTFLQPETTTIRTVGETADGTYQRVLQIHDADSRAAAMAILQASQTALYRPTWTVNSADQTYLDLELTILSMNDYIGDVWCEKGNNVNNVGHLIETLGAKYPSFREHLVGLNDAQLRSVLRHAMAGELTGNAFRVAIQQPSPAVFRHLDTVVPLRSPFTARGQVREGYNIWFNPFGQAERGKGDGTTLDGYNLSRFGFHLGSDIELYNRAVAGLFFGYTNPNVKSGLGKISANDYTAGLYFRVPFVWETLFNMMIGFGSQDYAYKNEFGKSDFRGSSLFASLELSRPFQMGNMPLGNSCLTPLIAMDFQSAKMDGFVMYDPILGGVFVEPEDISSAILRIGLLGEVGRFRTRLQYMRHLAGDDTVYSQTGVIGDLSMSTRVRGTQWGTDWLNVGIGGELLSTRHWRIFADYNFEVGKRTTSHLGSLNTVLRW